MARWALPGALAMAAGCATLLPPHVPGAHLSETRVLLHGHALKLRLSAPASPRGDVLLVYATGDAGWWGKDRAIFTALARWGYPVAGFSAREYVHHLGRDSVRPLAIAADFGRVIAAAKTALHLPAATRTVLVGKSRGAGLAIAAAGPQQLKPELEGIIAVGLTREEEYVHRRSRGRRSAPLAMLQTYPYLPQLGPLAVAVIQSTHDDYVPASEARQLFGQDTPVRRLTAIEARDHNFDGAIETLYREMERSFRWIVER